MPDEPLPFNFVTYMDDNTIIELRAKEGTKAVMEIQVIRSSPLSPPPPKPPDLNLLADLELCLVGLSINVVGQDEEGDTNTL